ncbi:MAG: hypothetical protein AAFR22_21365, partial [Chloroflexota bacterium]
RPHRFASSNTMHAHMLTLPPAPCATLITGTIRHNAHNPHPRRENGKNHFPPKTDHLPPKIPKTGGKFSNHYPITVQLQTAAGTVKNHRRRHR